MSDPFIGEIRMFAGNFSPRGWAFCDGQLLAISQFDALFSLLGTTYGGDGRTTFGLPDLRGRIPIHAGTGPGLTPRREGQRGGVENETLTVAQAPLHSHPVKASASVAGSRSPEGRVAAETSLFDFYQSGSPSAALDGGSVTAAGRGLSHTNIQPFLCVHFIIALIGLYPSRS
jgi:microcystin-dependent protein